MREAACTCCGSILPNLPTAVSTYSRTFFLFTPSILHSN